MHPLLYLSGAQHIKVLPSPGQSIMHTDTFVCVHIPLELIEKLRRGRDERWECRKSSMRNEIEAEEGKPIGKFQTFFFSFFYFGVCVLLP